MKEYLYQVGIKDKKTGEELNLRVWAKNTDEATHKLCDVLIGYDSAGLAEYLLLILKAHFPISEMLEDYDIEEKDLLDEIEYALDDIGL